MGDIRKILVVEDDDSRIRWFRRATIGFVVHFAKTAAEAKKYLEDPENDYVQIFLDHDLKDFHYLQDCADDEETGYEVTIFLSDFKNISENAEIIIHSCNIIGAKRMAVNLTDRNVRLIPFPKLQELVQI